MFLKTTNYYAIAKKKSKTNSKSYINFLKNNKLYFKEINETNLFEKKNIDKTFLVKEKIINIFKARNFLKEKIRKNKKINFKLKKKFDYKKSENYDFYGYIEGNQIMDGKINVIISDGFTGNVAL